MLQEATPFVELDEKRSEVVANLIKTSHEKFMDVNSVLPWEKGIDRHKYPKDPTHSWIYGTKWWDQLTEEQRLETLWHETARDCSMFIALETSIPPLYVGHINRYGKTLTKELYEYLMIFSKEEIVHTLMFQRYLKEAGLRIFRPPEGIFELLVEKMPKMHPVAGMLCTVVVELAAELAALAATQGNNIEPVTAELFYQHHVEEARHIAFGRLIGDAYFETAPEAEAEEIRNVVRGLLARLIPQFTYNPEIAEHTSFRFPISPDDKAAIEAVRNSEANKELNKKRWAPLFAWLAKNKIIE